MTTTRLIRSTLLVAVIAVAGQCVTAADGLRSVIKIAGHEIPLQATATRSKLWVDVYDCGIYAESEVTPDNPAGGAATAVDFVVKTNLLPPRPPAAWQENIREAIKEQHYETLVEHFEGLRPNEHLTFVFVPEEGTSVYVDEAPVFTTADAGLLEAVLQMLVGEAPVSEDVKTQLLDTT
ncbi:MAG: chalcone isomerase family protein [Gammaproteobacteria bacterium]